MFRRKHQLHISINAAYNIRFSIYRYQLSSLSYFENKSTAEYNEWNLEKHPYNYITKLKDRIDLLKHPSGSISLLKIIIYDEP